MSSRGDFKRKVIAGLTVIGLFLLLFWLPYVTFSESLIKSVCAKRLPLEQSIELVDIICLTFLIFVLLLIVMALVIFRVLKSINFSKKKNSQPVPGGGGKKTGKKLAFGIITIVLCLCLIILLWYVRFNAYKKSLVGYEARNNPAFKMPETPNLTSRDILSLGWAHTREEYPEYSYILFPEAKKPGTIRIGIFGCSFVQGMEVAKGHEFPTFLQKKFYEEGLNNVEVINFGVNGYGTHQAYLLYEALGCKYNLDYTVFLPLELHESRDRSFIYQNLSYLPVHARFIARQGELELINVLGESQLEATRKYFQFIPPWRYLRYDEKAPVSLYALRASKSREMNNPFYYVPHKDKKREVLETYALLFDKLGSRANNVIVIIEDDYIREIKEKVTASNLTFLDSQAPQLRNSFLYRAPIGHHSAIGQKLQSDELFDFLRGKDRPTFDYIQIEKDENEPAGTYDTQPLHMYNKVSLGIEKTPVAHFGLPGGDTAIEPRCNSRLEFKKNKISSLLLQTDGEIIRFIPLPFRIKDEEPVYLTIRTGKNAIEVPVGSARSRGGVVGKLLLASRDLNWPEAGSRISAAVQFDSLDLPDRLIVQSVNEKVDRCDLAIGKNVALRAKEVSIHRLINFLRRLVFLRRQSLMVYHLRFKPVLGEYSYLKAGPGEYVDMKGPGEQVGTVDLLLTDDQGKTEEVPAFLRYSFSQVPASPFKPALKNCIK